MLALPLLALSLLACRSHERPPEDAGWAPPTARSGSRLRRRMAELDSGERVFLGWHDTELDVDCSFRPGADGVLRCRPSGGNANAFLDPACAMRVADTTAGCPPRRFVSRALDGVCPGADETFRVGARLEPSDVFRVSGERECDRSHDALRDRHDYYALERVAESQLVAGEIVVPPRSDARVVPAWLVTKDGGAEVFGLYDGQRSELCDPWPYAEESPCVPRSAARVRRGSGAECDSDWAVSEECHTRPDVAVRAFTDACREPEARLVGALAAELPAECSFVGPGTRYEHAPAPAGTFGRVTREPARDGPVQVRRWVASDGTLVVAPWPLRDPSRGEWCSPLELGGVTVCAPTAVGSGGLFADSECTIPASDFIPLASCAELHFFTHDGCGAPERLYRPGPTPEAVYELTGGDCRPSAVSPVGFSTLIEVPLAELPQLRVVIE